MFYQSQSLRIRYNYYAILNSMFQELNAVPYYKFYLELLQVEFFLNKIVNFPLEITCCKIHSLDCSYLSSAIPSIITYVLVLMQFKQGDEGSEELIPT